jgi:hypothetical protein
MLVSECLLDIGEIISHCVVIGDNRLDAVGQVLICSIKVEVKKKHISAGWTFSCFAAHLMEQDLF